MSGLITKDIRQLLQRKEQFLLFVIMAAFMGFALDGTFVIGYVTLLGSTLALGTLSYDELDNGLTFIMTLPIKRKTFVTEKYLFCFATACVFWVLAYVVYIVAKTVRHIPMDPVSELPVAIAFLPAMMIITSVMIPIQLKFGSQRSRVIMMVLFGGVAVIILMFSDFFGTDNRLAVFVNFLDSINPMIVVRGLLSLCAIFILVSALISVKVIEKKEF